MHLQVFYLIEPCNEAGCSDPNETCNSDGSCWCGMGPSCQDKYWAPTCWGVKEAKQCRCGSEPACNEGTEICNPSDGSCSPYGKKLKTIRNSYQDEN